MYSHRCLLYTKRLHIYGIRHHKILVNRDKQFYENIFPLYDSNNGSTILALVRPPSLSLNEDDLVIIEEDTTHVEDDPSL